MLLRTSVNTTRNKRLGFEGKDRVTNKRLRAQTETHLSPTVSYNLSRPHSAASCQGTLTTREVRKCRCEGQVLGINSKKLPVATRGFENHLASKCCGLFLHASESLQVTFLETWYQVPHGTSFSVPNTNWLHSYSTCPLNRLHGSWLFSKS